MTDWLLEYISKSENNVKSDLQLIDYDKYPMVSSSSWKIDVNGCLNPVEGKMKLLVSNKHLRLPNDTHSLCGQDVSNEVTHVLGQNEKLEELCAECVKVVLRLRVKA